MIVEYDPSNDMTYISKWVNDSERWVQVGFTREEVNQIASAKEKEVR